MRPAISPQLGEAGATSFGEGGLASGNNVGDMRKRLKTLVGAGVPRPSFGRDSFTHRRGEDFRNETKIGSPIVPESLRRQEDKANSMCLGLQRNRRQTKVNRVVCVVCHGKRMCETAFATTSESVKVLEFDMDFCYLLQDPKCRHQPGDQAWAKTLVMVDVAAQNTMSAAVPTKSDEDVYLSALCTALVQRMVYAEAVLKVDPEEALKTVADKIALRGQRRRHPTGGRNGTEVQQQEHRCSGTSTRCAG